MSGKLYLNLLVLFGVLFQGIIGTLSEKEIDESSDLLVRQKRVINRLTGGDVRASMKNNPYVVSVKKLRLNDSCVGAILSPHTVLTTAYCAVSHVSNYRIYSGCARVSRNGHPKIHNVIDKRVHIGNHPSRPYDGIALMTVDPPFTYTANTYYIKLYEGPMLPGFRVSVAGWGCNPTGHCGTAHPEWLRSITVPVISTEDCNILYLEHYTVSDSDICTLDAFGNQYCGANDAGAPLVIEVGYINKLAGIHLWNGGIVGRSNPDVFVNLQHPAYKTWIQENIQH